MTIVQVSSSPILNSRHTLSPGLSDHVTIPARLILSQNTIISRSFKAETGINFVVYEHKENAVLIQCIKYLWHETLSLSQNKNMELIERANLSTTRL